MKRVLKTVLKPEKSLQQIDQTMQSIARHYGTNFLVLVSIYGLVYFSEFAEYALRADEEFAYARVYQWTPLGRWGTQIIADYFMIHPLNPYFSILMFGFCLATSFLLFMRTMQIQPTPFILLSFAVFCGFPTWSYLLEFKGTILANGLSILLSSLAGYIFVRRKRSAVLFVIFLVSALSIYQSSIFIAISVSISSILFDVCSKPKERWAVLRSFFRLLILSFVSIIIYLIVWKGLLSYLNLEPKYLRGFLALDKLVQEPRTVCLAIIEQGIAFFMGYHEIFNGIAPLTGLLFVLGLIALILGFYRIKTSSSESIFLFLLLIALLVSPFFLNLFSGGYLPYRTLWSVPYVYWFFVVSALKSTYPHIQLAAKILVLLVIIQYLQISSFFSFSHHFVAAHDQLTASQVYDRIVNQLEDYDRNESYPIEFVGPLRFANYGNYIKGGSAVTGSSIFEWDAGEPSRARAFLRTLGMGNFYGISDRQRWSILPEFQKMPLWPNKGSVRIVRGIIVVKFGEYSEHIIKRLEAQKNK